jgi:phosphohistidine phosphatase
MVYFLRHASAGQKRATRALDEKRPLDKEGIEQCRYMGRALAALDAQVDAVISSPLKRATQTAALVGNEIGHEGKLKLDPALRPEGDFESFRELLESHRQEEAILVVGHNPSLSHFLSLLVSGGSNRTAVNLRKGAIARVEINVRRPTILSWCLTPKVVRAIYESCGAKSSPKTSLK